MKDKPDFDLEAYLAASVVAPDGLETSARTGVIRLGAQTEADRMIVKGEAPAGAIRDFATPSEVEPGAFPGA